MQIDPHKFLNPKNVFYKPVCTKCGLMALNNAITHWCIRNGCDYDEHPDYKKTLKELTGLNWGKK